MAIRPSSSLSRMKALGLNKPGFSLGIGLPWNREGEYRRPLPFKKYWGAIIFMGVFLGGFSIPLFTFNLLGDTEDLFDLTFNLFTLFWLLGWSVAVAVIALIFLGLLFAREVLVVDRDSIRLRIEVLGIGVGAIYPARHISNLRMEKTEKPDGNAWRSLHLAFDYCGVPVGFGSELDGETAAEIMERIRSTLTQNIGQKAAVLSPKAKSKIEQPAPRNMTATSAASGNREPMSLAAPSTLALIAANLVPLVGILFLSWDIGELMLLFWMESAIVGFYNLLKMTVIGKWSVLFLGPFFLGHYGGFMAGHLLFIFAFFVQTPDQTSMPLNEVANVFLSLWPALLALFLSHGFSFWNNFIGKREYLGKTINQQMSDPYKRIIVMHITIIFGGFLVMLLETPLPAMVLMVVLKIMSDVKAHVHEHGTLTS